MPDSFDAFISYRRSDGEAFARALRRALRDFRPPRALRKSRDPLNIYLDTMYERATKDFYEGVTRPALLGSQYLIVVVTPAAADRGPGLADWMRKEIEDFEEGPNAGNIMVVLAKGTMETKLPGNLGERYPNVEIMDLRGLGVLSFLNPLKATRLSDELVKLAAPLLRLKSEDMPVLRREEERRQQVRLGLAGGSATTIVAAVAALSVWAFYSRNSALDAISRSLFATDRVIQSVAGAMAPSAVRSNLMASTCDLLDSLERSSVRQPRTNALVLCAVERSESRDRQSERVEAGRILNAALSIAEQQYARSRSPDDAAAVLEAKRAILARSLAAGDPDLLPIMEAFIRDARRLIKELPSETRIAGSGADALQTMAVGLAEKGLLRPAATAIDAALGLRELAAKGDGPGPILETIATVSLKAEIHKRNNEDAEHGTAAARARTLFAAIDMAAVSKEGLEGRYREVMNLVPVAVVKK